MEPPATSKEPRVQQPRRRLALVLAVGLAVCAVAAGPAEALEGPLSEQLVGRDVAHRFPPLEAPEVRDAESAGHMRPEDPVVGLVIAGAARAYPWWVLKNYHAVNDTIEGVPVVIAFCEQCSGATAFRRELDDGRVLSMETEGVGHGSIILSDRQTGTLWAPFDGEGLEGALAGERLTRVPVFLTTWRDWRTRHPGTDVVYEREQGRHGHGERERPGYWGIVGEMGETLGTWDGRLAEHELVFGSYEGRVSRAYPFGVVESRGGVVNDTLGGRPIAVMARGSFEMAAYDRRLGARTLTLRPDGSPFRGLRDEETGTLWSLEGRAVEGPLEGKQLSPANGYSVEWHVWSEYHPQTEIFGAGDAHLPTGWIFPITELSRLAGPSLRMDRLPLDSEVNLVFVWARWCPPCREKVPLMKRLEAQSTEAGFGFVTIAVQLPNLAEIGELRAFLRQREIDLPVFLFDDRRYEELDRTYRGAGGRGLIIPTLFVVDDNRIVTRVLEGTAIDEVESLLREELLARPGSPG